MGLSAEDVDYLYFQPPESMKIKYNKDGAIIYSKTGLSPRRANDRIYTLQDSYSLTLITRNPDSTFPQRFQEEFPTASPGRVFVANNLYHHPFTLVF